MSDNLVLNCLIENNPEEMVFEVKLEKNSSVLNLRKKIKEEMPFTFAEIEINEIVLWKVNVPSDETIKVNIVLNEIQEKLKLSKPFQKIGNIFTESIPDSIQIIVERPSGEKREKEIVNLKRCFTELANELTNELTNEIREVEGKITGLRHEMAGLGHEMKKIRLQSEVAWFSAPGVTTATEKGQFVIDYGKCIGFPLKLTTTTLKEGYGKFREPPSPEVPEKILQEYFVNECQPLIRLKNSNLMIEDVHSISLLATRKLDFVFIAKGCPLDALHVIAVGEIKKDLAINSVMQM
ncbi:hypothetical protein C2G38_2048800 [Gigaspora rosea]|uniref:Uncharacterized protein n=1 Tax=Gigaspora rosea TaxID=44941 RepID=A0A397U4E7_9GLOM|nr:hypothetical protein C2G38_2048800 [Gigaspora rosea]